VIWLICIRPFGERVPGDRVLVPDGIFDAYYFKRAPEEDED